MRGPSMGACTRRRSPTASATKRASPTIAVGAIFEADHANSIIAAGRADLCAIARPHLANPAWTLTEAAKLGYGDIEWPRQYQAAKAQLERNLQREREVAAANAGLTPLEIAANLLGS